MTNLLDAIEEVNRYKLSAGQVILFSEGCYSDFGYCGQVVFTKDCDLRELSKEFLTPERKDSWYNKSAFVTWLVANQYCMPLECREIHLGDYSFIFDSDGGK